MRGLEYARPAYIPNGHRDVDSDSAQVLQLPFGQFGHIETAAIHGNVAHLTRQLRTHLTHQHRFGIASRIVARSNDDAYSKMSLVALKLQSRGPTRDIALDWASPVRHAAALVAFFADDFFLAQHSGNYLGKAFIPNNLNNLERLRPSTSLRPVTVRIAAMSIGSFASWTKLTLSFTALYIGNNGRTSSARDIVFLESGIRDRRRQQAETIQRQLFASRLGRVN